MWNELKKDDNDASTNSVSSSINPNLKPTAGRQYWQRKRIDAWGWEDIYRKHALSDYTHLLVTEDIYKQGRGTFSVIHEVNRDEACGYMQIM
jgi:hypothetical protein